MPPPPISLCSVNTLPTSNRAVLFGGMVIDDNGLHRSNDVYIITYTKNQVVSYTCNVMYMFMYVLNYGVYICIG